MTLSQRDRKLTQQLLYDFPAEQTYMSAVQPTESRVFNEAECLSNRETSSVDFCETTACIKAVLPFIVEAISVSAQNVRSCSTNLRSFQVHAQISSGNP